MNSSNVGHAPGPPLFNSERRHQTVGAVATAAVAAVEPVLTRSATDPSSSCRQRCGAEVA